MLYMTVNRALELEGHINWDWISCGVLGVENMSPAFLVCGAYIALAFSLDAGMLG